MGNNRCKDVVLSSVGCVRTSNDPRAICEALRVLGNEVFWEDKELREYAAAQIREGLDRYDRATSESRQQEIGKAEIRSAFLDVLQVISYWGVKWAYVRGDVRGAEVTLYATGWDTFSRAPKSKGFPSFGGHPNVVVFTEEDAKNLAKRWSQEGKGGTALWSYFPAGGSYPSNRPPHRLVSR